MSSSYFNMAAGAFLGTCFVAMTLSIVSGAIYYSPNPEKEGFVIKAEKTAATGESKPAKPEVPPIAPLLQKADVKKGAQVFKKCEACHSGTKGGPNKIGPDLWNIVDRPIASHQGFSYSSALKKFSDDSKKKWTYERLNHWLHDPRGYVSGTAMTFPGVKDNQDRADVIAYLHTLADNPVPYPKPEAAKGEKAAAGNAEAGKTAAAGESKATKPEAPSIVPRLQKADVKKGAQIFKTCEACHSSTKGGPNKIGPDLWNVVDRPIASYPGYNYSSALKKFSDDSKKKWTFERLDNWLHDPRGYVSGTAMTFPGVKNSQDRADVIAYLHTLSDNPVPYPKPDSGKGASDQSAPATQKPAGNQ